MNSNHGGHDHEHSDSHGHGNSDNEHSHDGHSHGDGHGHANDQGLSGMVRYLRHAPRMWRSTINQAAVELLAPQSNETVLDIGAGMGAGTMVAAKRGAKVVSIEPTPFLRRVLSFRRVLQRARKRILVVNGAAENLSVDAQSIDAIWSVNTMHHWVDQADAAAEIVRALRPGGRLLLIDEDFQDPTHPEYEVFAKHNQHDSDEADSDNTHHGFTMVDADEMGTLLTEAGLSSVSADKQSVKGRPVIMITGTA